MKRGAFLLGAAAMSVAVSVFARGRGEVDVVVIGAGGGSIGGDPAPTAAPTCSCWRRCRSSAATRNLPPAA